MVEEEKRKLTEEDMKLCLVVLFRIGKERYFSVEEEWKRLSHDYEYEETSEDPILWIRKVISFEDLDRIVKKLSDYSYCIKIKAPMSLQAISDEQLKKLQGRDSTSDGSGIITIEEAYFENIEFQGGIIFENKHYGSNFRFENCVINYLWFAESTFHGNLRFHDCTFLSSCDFSNTTFKKLLDFYESTFKMAQQFHLTDFMDRAIFSNVTFEGPVQFLHNKTESSSVISFENATFHKGLDMSRANFWCTLQFWGVKFVTPKKKQKAKACFIKKQWRSLQTWILSKLCNEAQKDVPVAEIAKENLYLYDQPEEDELSGDDQQKEKKEVKSLKQLRESFRIIKHAFISSGNKIESYQFHQLEMRAYRAELWQAGRCRRKSDKLLLFLNRVSNNYGLTWWYALLWLLGGVAISSYFLLAVHKGTFAAFNCHDYWQVLITQLNPTHRLASLGLGEELNNCVLTLDYFTRVYGGFCIYQLVAAFRKYGKN